jgi:hypothetical protein
LRTKIIDAWFEKLISLFAPIYRKIYPTFGSHGVSKAIDEEKRKNIILGLAEDGKTQEQNPGERLFQVLDKLKKRNFTTAFFFLNRTAFSLGNVSRRGYSFASEARFYDHKSGNDLSAMDLEIIQMTTFLFTMRAKKRELNINHLMAFGTPRTEPTGTSNSLSYRHYFDACFNIATAISHEMCAHLEKHNKLLPPYSDRRIHVIQMLGAMQYFICKGWEEFSLIGERPHKDDLPWAKCFEQDLQFIPPPTVNNMLIKQAIERCYYASPPFLQYPVAFGSKPREGSCYVLALSVIIWSGLLDPKLSDSSHVAQELTTLDPENDPDNWVEVPAQWSKYSVVAICKKLVDEPDTVLDPLAVLVSNYSNEAVMKEHKRLSDEAKHTNNYSSKLCALIATLLKTADELISVCKQEKLLEEDHASCDKIIDDVQTLNKKFQVVMQESPFVDPNQIIPLQYEASHPTMVLGGCNFLNCPLERLNDVIQCNNCTACGGGCHKECFERAIQNWTNPVRVGFTAPLCSSCVDETLKTVCCNFRKRPFEPQNPLSSEYTQPCRQPVTHDVSQACAICKGKMHSVCGHRVGSDMFFQNSGSCLFPLVTSCVLKGTDYVCAFCVFVLSESYPTLATLMPFEADFQLAEA